MHVTVSASGYSLPPFIIFENCFPSGPYGRNGPNNALYGISPNGYMDSELFKKCVEKVSPSDTPFATTTIINSGWSWFSYEY